MSHARQQLNINFAKQVRRWSPRILFASLIAAAVVWQSLPPTQNVQAAVISISGNLYSGEGTGPLDCNAVAKTVVIQINGLGNYTSDCTTSDGAYTVSGITVNANDVITAYLSTEIEKAVTISLAASSPSNMTGFDLYQNRVIVRHENAGPITNNDMQFDNDDDGDIPFTSNVGVMLVNDATELHVWTGKTYTPGGTVTTSVASTSGSTDGDVHIASGANLSMGTNALSIGGDLNNQGTFSASATQTTTMTATGSGFSFTHNNSTFQNLTFNGASGAWTIANTNLTVSGNFTITTGTVTAPTGTLSIAGNWGNTGTFTHNSGKVQFNGSGTQTITTSNTILAGGGGVALTQTAGKQFYDVEFAGSGTMTLGSGTGRDLGAERHVILTSGTFDVGDNDNRIALKGDWDASTVTDSNFNAREGTASAIFQVNFIGTATQHLKVQSGQSMTFYSLQFGDINLTETTYYLTSVGGAAGTVNFQQYFMVLSGDVDTKDGSSPSTHVTGLSTTSQMYIGDEAGEDSAAYKRFHANDSTISLDRLIITDGRTAGDDSTFFAMNSTITAGPSSGEILVGDTGNLTHTENIFDASASSSSTITAKWVNMQVGTFILGNSRTWNISHNTGSSIRVFANGTWNAASSNATISFEGTLQVDAGGTFNSGSTTMVMDGTAAQTVDPDADIVFNNLTIDDSGSRTVTFADLDTSGRRIAVNGTFTWDQTVAANAANLQVGNGAFTATLALDNATPANASIAIPTGKTLTMITTSTLELAGSFTNDGTFTQATSTVLMDGTGNIAGTTNTTFNNLTISSTGNAAATLTASDPTVSALLTIDASDSLTLNSGRTMTLSGNTGTTLSLNTTGSIVGAGRLTYQNSATTVPTTGTISSIFRFDTVNGNQIFPQRTFSGVVEAFNGTTTARTLTLGTASSQSLNAQGLLVIANGASPGNMTVTGATHNPDIVISGNLDYTGTGSGTEIIISGSGTWSIGGFGNVDFTAGTYTATTGNTLKFISGSQSLNTSNQSLYNLTIDVITGLAVTVTGSDATVTNILTIGGVADGNTDTLTIDTGRKVISDVDGTVTLVGSGTDTIDGAGTLVIRHSNLGTGGTISSNVYFAGQITPIIMPARTYSGASRTVTIGNECTGGSGQVTSAAGTITIQGSFLMDDECDDGLVFDASTNNSTITISGNVSATGPITTIGMGSGTWTVGGHFDLTNIGTFSHDNGTLVMNGTGTLTSNGKTLGNYTINTTGTVTLANATHTINGHFKIILGSTVSAGTSTILMNGLNKDLEGGFTGINNLTIDPTSSSTITLRVSSLTVNGTLNVATGDTLSLFGGLELTHAGATLTLNGTIAGAGRYIYQSATTFPTTGTISANLRFDATNTNQVVPVRTYGSPIIELYNSGSTNRTITFGTASAQTLTFPSSVNLVANGTGNLTVDADDFVDDPEVSISGTLDFIGTGAGSETIISGDGTWTVGNNVDFTGGTYTATSGNTLLMNGSSRTLTTAGNSLYNFEQNGGSTTFSDAATLANNFVITSGTVTAPSSTLAVGGSWTNSGTFTHNSGTVALTGTATAVLTGNTTFQNLSVTSLGAAKTLTFTGGSTQTVAGTWTITGASGQIVTLQSSDTNAWNINPTNASVSYATVSRSNNQGATICATFSTGGVGNTNWIFSSSAACESPSITDNQAGDATPRNAAGTTYDVDFHKGSSSSTLDYAQYRVHSASGLGGTLLIDWTDIFTSDVDDYTTDWSINFAVLPEGTSYVSVRVFDVDARSAQANDVFTVTKDTVGPVISSLATSSTNTSITISWTTDEAATTQVEWGTTTNYGQASTLDANLTTTHSVTISGLDSGTTYHLRARSQDQAGNLSVSNDLAVTTGAAVLGHCVRPTLLTPVVTNGTNPTIYVIGLGKGSQTIRVYLDGTLVGQTTLASGFLVTRSFSIPVQLASVGSGEHTITVQATDHRNRVCSIGPNQTLTLSATRNGIISFGLESPSQYVVKGGDSLWTIALRFLGFGRRYVEIVTLNAIRFPSLLTNPNLIFPGWLLGLPAR